MRAGICKTPLHAISQQHVHSQVFRRLARTNREPESGVAQVRVESLASDARFDCDVKVVRVQSLDAVHLRQIETYSILKHIFLIFWIFRQDRKITVKFHTDVGMAPPSNPVPVPKGIIAIPSS